MFFHLGVVSIDTGYGRSWLVVLTSKLKDSPAGDNLAVTLIDTEESLTRLISAYTVNPRRDTGHDSRHASQSTLAPIALQLLLLRLVLSAAARAVANNSCVVVASAVCECRDVRLLVCVHTSSVAYLNAQRPRHGVIKRTIGGSLAHSCPPTLPRAADTYCWWACVLQQMLLPILVLLLELLLYQVCDCRDLRLLCVRMFAYVWSFLAWARGAECFVRYTTLCAATAATAASASTYFCRRRCCCCCCCCLLP